LGPLENRSRREAHLPANFHIYINGLHKPSLEASGIKNTRLLPWIALFLVDQTEFQRSGHGLDCGVGHHFPACRRKQIVGDGLTTVALLGLDVVCPAARHQLKAGSFGTGQWFQGRFHQNPQL